MLPDINLANNTPLHHLSKIDNTNIKKELLEPAIKDESPEVTIKDESPEVAIKEESPAISTTEPIVKIEPRSPSPFPQTTTLPEMSAWAQRTRQRQLGGEAFFTPAASNNAACKVRLNVFRPASSPDRANASINVDPIIKTEPRSPSPAAHPEMLAWAQRTRERQLAGEAYYTAPASNNAACRVRFCVFRPAPTQVSDRTGAGVVKRTYRRNGLRN